MPTPRRRTATGCIGCRLRRKKCSLEKPQCANCVRNKILCSWAEPGNPHHAELLRRTNPTRRRSHHLAANLPVCTSDDRRNSVASKPCDDSLANDVIRLPRSLNFLLDSNPLLKRPSSRRLFDHYVHRTNKAMAVCRGTANPFMAQLVPIAFSDQAVMNAVLACSGVHLAALTDTRLDEATWTHYGLAIQSQKFALTRLDQGDSDVLFSLLVTATILCTVEAFRANSASLALYHLKASKALFEKAIALPQSLLGQPAASFLIERYTYTMVLAHISMGSTSDEWVLDETSRLFDLIRTFRQANPGSLSGCVHELFELIPRVTVFARKATSESHDATDVTDIWKEYLYLEKTISSWQPDTEDATNALCGQVYQQALLVYLASLNLFDQDSFDTLATVTPYSHRVQAAFDRFLSFLETIPLESPISTCLCWPLAVFGACAKVRSHQNMIRSWLENLATAYSAPGVRETKQLLELLWVETASGRPANPLSFDRLMKKNITVLFF